MSLGLLLASCMGSKQPAWEDPLYGAITSPFVQPPPLGTGRLNQEEKFIIRSIYGDKEYVVEIPGAAKDYDIELPLASLGENTSPDGPPKDLPKPGPTDQELLAQVPHITRTQANQAALLDKAFGVVEGTYPGPSYTLGLAKINEYYRKHQFEFALVELNHLLSYYPQSPQLHKMKGTVLLKMHQLILGQKAWQRALDLTPEDKALQNALGRLKIRLERTETPEHEEGG